MAELSTPRPGLRPAGVRVFNKSHDVAKVGIVVPAGAEIVADEYVAAQLLAQSSAFVQIDATSGGDVVAGVAEDDSASSSATPPPIVEEAGGVAARRASGRRKGQG